MGETDVPHNRISLFSATGNSSRGASHPSKKWQPKRLFPTPSRCPHQNTLGEDPFDTGPLMEQSDYIANNQLNQENATASWHGSQEPVQKDLREDVQEEGFTEADTGSQGCNPAVLEIQTLCLPRNPTITGIEHPWIRMTSQGPHLQVPAITGLRNQH
ncbi:hypothetical protein K491DRAFT_675526 [Lophiostoma macrostomum CBS 122681]|uniref:Uncharacterized protein n=1 Tax=Lophiostoma macrostomum CBS 122681 TaxID=1314788 RepID=A0A6A6TJE3_9PLEO|nr:hypothetical protein K491DRAFT_675526 [Lophiostoma macrostomum CBS 122681]